MKFTHYYCWRKVHKLFPAVQEFKNGCLIIASFLKKVLCIARYRQNKLAAQPAFIKLFSGIINVYCKQPGQQNEIDKYFPAAPRKAIRLIVAIRVVSFQPTQWLCHVVWCSNKMKIVQKNLFAITHKSIIWI